MSQLVVGTKCFLFRLTLVIFELLLLKNEKHDDDFIKAFCVRMILTIHTAHNATFTDEWKNIRKHVSVKHGNVLSNEDANFSRRFMKCMIMV